MTSPLRLCVRRTPVPIERSRAVRVSLQMPNDVGLIEETVELVALHCFAGRPVGTRTTFRLRVALAEALANAIQCGNGGDPDRTVTVEAELLLDQIRLGVTDEGDGFDPTQLPDPTAPGAIESPCGRGLFLIRSLADRVTFNDRGNTIWIDLPRS